MPNGAPHPQHPNKPAMHSLRAILFLGPLALAPGLVFADTLVSWGNNASADTTPSGEYVVSGAISFSTSTPRSSASANYNTGTSRVFYGGAISTGTSGGINGWFVDDSTATTGFTAGDDVHNFRVSTASIGAVGYSVMLWKQADFVTDSTGNVKITDFSYRGRAAGSGLGADVRFVIVSNGVTLVSSAQSIIGVTAPTLTLANLGTQSWFAYDPAASISSIGASYDVAGFNFDNATMVGVLLRQEKLSGTSANMSIVSQSFSVNGVAIPEPSVYALMGGIAGLAWAACRRRSSLD